MIRRKPRPEPMQVERARKLRREATFPEKILWALLRSQQLAEMKFRRQHPIGSYIVDFYCAAKQLAIELDGLSHDGREAKDEEHTRHLNRQGVRVVRFTNDEVLRDRRAVAYVIARECGIDG